MFLLFSVGLLLALVSCGHGTEIFIEVRREVGAGRYRVVDSFRYSKPFVRTSANVPTEGIQGPVHVAGSGNVPSRANTSWIAVVLEPSENKAFELLRNGCVSMIVPLHPNNTRFLRISPLPTVLVERAVTDFLLAQPPGETVTLHIRAGSKFEAVVFAVCGLGAVCLGASVCLTWHCYRRREDPRSARRHHHQPVGGLQESIRRHIRQLQAEDPNQVQVPLGDKLTRQLPTSRYKRRSGDSPPCCAVCMNDYRNWERVRTLTCGHFFHVACIDEWLTKYSSLCPLCKKSAIERPVESSFSTSVSIHEHDGITAQVVGSRGRLNYGSLSTGAVI